MGDNIYLGDRNGVRTPMQWSADRNAGFSRANPQRLYLPVIIDPEYHYEAVNVEAQQDNPHSLLWWMKRLIALRKRHQRVRPRDDSSSCSPRTARCSPSCASYEDERDPGRREPVALRAVRRARPRASSTGCVPGRAVRPRRVPADRRARRTSLTLGPARLLLVPLEPTARRPPRSAAAGGPARRSSVPATARRARRPTRRLGRARPRPCARWLRDRRWFAARRATHPRHCAIVDTVPEPGAAGAPSRWRSSRSSYTEGEPETYLPCRSRSPTAARSERRVADADRALLARDGARRRACSDRRRRGPGVRRRARSTRSAARGARRAGSGELARSRHDGVRVGSAREDRDARRPPHPRPSRATARSSSATG